ncbi:CAP domain-containing protein [Streptomyces sp. NPDC048659]|uniref:CAP domain-containing protein n=1 Tax=Streptomyces sp. NPDC048659 TaxID=3155489 RepID=UPI003438979C
MQRTTGFEQLTDAELIRAAQYGDTWARERLIGAYQPLVHVLAVRALDGRPGADAAVHAIVRDTLSRAEFALGTLLSPEMFRPWLVGIGVASTLAHAAGIPDGLWLDVEDAVLSSLWSLEQEGHLSRYETAAALGWSPQDMAQRMEAVRVRLDAVQSVTLALARAPRCAALAERAAAWDGLPGAFWRDELARHTAHCGYCATGIGAAGRAGMAGMAGEAWSERPSVVDGASPLTVSEGATVSLAPTETLAPTEAAALAPTAPFAVVSPVPAAGRRATRATRRRRRQADERNRRRAVVAAGLAVVAVTGGALTLHAGRGDDDVLDGGRAAAAPDLDPNQANEPGTLSAPPSASASGAASASPSATQTSAAPKTPAATPSKTAGATTKPPAPKRTATTPAAPSKTAKPPVTDGGSGGGGQQDPGQSSAADQVVALVNAERAKAGCGPLTSNATLVKAAQGHSDDMAARDFFDHTNPDGAGPGDRVTAAGYPWTTYGENIAMGQSTPAQVMESWMNSPGHRANILNCDFKEIGVGVHDAGGPYWTQVFGAR